MNESPVEEFGQRLMKHVRDAAVKSCDQQLQPDSRSPVAKRWRDHHHAPGVLIPDCVDETLFHLLNAVDQGLIKLSFLSKTGEMVDLNVEGLSELAGAFMASGGWRAEYSSERSSDDFNDLS